MFFCDKYIIFVLVDDTKTNNRQAPIRLSFFNENINF